MRLYFLEVDRNHVYQEPNQEPGSEAFWKPSNRTRNREVIKNKNREPTSYQEPNQEFKALFLVSPGTYWSNQELTTLNQELYILYLIYNKKLLVQSTPISINSHFYKIEKEKEYSQRRKRVNSSKTLCIEVNCLIYTPKVLFFASNRGIFLQNSAS